MKEKKEKDKAEAEATLAQLTELYDDTEKQMKADIEFFDATKVQCLLLAKWKVIVPKASSLAPKTFRCARCGIFLKHFVFYRWFFTPMILGLHDERKLSNSCPPSSCSSDSPQSDAS
eukprot:3478649-Amphidinium_carterae.1